MPNRRGDSLGELFFEQLRYTAVSPFDPQLECLDVLTRVERSSLLQRVKSKMALSTSSAQALVRQGSMLSEDLIGGGSKWLSADADLDRRRDGLAELRDCTIKQPSDETTFKKNQLPKTTLSFSKSSKVEVGAWLGGVTGVCLEKEESLVCTMDGLTAAVVDYETICNWISAGGWCPNRQTLQLCSADWANGSKMKSLWIVTEVLYATRLTLTGRSGLFNRVDEQVSIGNVSGGLKVRRANDNVVDLEAKRDKHFIIGYRTMQVDYNSDGTLRGISAPGGTRFRGHSPHLTIAVSMKGCTSEVDEDGAEVSIPLQTSTNHELHNEAHQQMNLNSLEEVVEVNVRPSPKRYLEFATTCMERVAQDMTSLQLNFELCEYLQQKLLSVIQIARDCCPSESSLGITESGKFDLLGTFKLLLRLANDVQHFVHDCHSDQWIQHAIMFINSSEYVSLVGYELDFCENLLRIAKGERGSDVCAPSFYEADIIKRHALHDRSILLKKLEALTQSSNQSTATLATELKGRLTLAPSTCIEPGSEGSSTSLWKLDPGSDILKLDYKAVGVGSWGTAVYKSKWLDKSVAVKSLPGGLDNLVFKNEVSMLARLSHPHVVPMFYYATDSRRGCYIVMEFMEKDLFQLMKEIMQKDLTLDCPFSPLDAVDFMLQVAEGVCYLHRNNVVHRDLKSQNILVNIARYMRQEHVYVKVADFGLSKVKEKTLYPELTRNQGTSRWMAPEMMAPKDTPGSQAMNQYNPFKCDVYSFAMVCYEILTGKLPFDTTHSNTAVREMVLKGLRPPLPNLRPEMATLISLIEACWAHHASIRPDFDSVCATLRNLKFSLMTGRQTACPLPTQS